MGIAESTSAAASGSLPLCAIACLTRGDWTRVSNKITFQRKLRMLGETSGSSFASGGA